MPQPEVLVLLLKTSLSLGEFYLHEDLAKRPQLAFGGGGAVD